MPSTHNGQKIVEDDIEDYKVFKASKISLEENILASLMLWFMTST